MNFSLRNLALGAAVVAVGAMNAQETPTVTQKWITHEGITADVRGGNGFGGKVYVGDGASIKTIENGTVTTLYTHESGLNKGFAIDEAGNIAVHIGFPVSDANWMNYLLIKADGSEAKEITLTVPTESSWAPNRADLTGRAVGDFFSADGGVFYLTANTATYPIPVWISNGEPETLDYATSVDDFAAANTTAYAQPALSFADIDSDNVSDAFYYYTGSSAWNVGYVDEKGAAAFFAEPTAEEMAAKLPADWAKQTQNGFDVFELGGKKYVIRMSGKTTWNADFFINDEDGNIVFHTEYGEGWNNPANGNAGYGCGVFARKVSDYKVEIYQIFKCGVIENSFAAMYEVTIPEPAPQSLYIVGAFQNWDPENPAEFTLGEDGKYTYNYVQEGVSGFKISTAKGAWDAEGGFNSGVLGVEGNTIATGNTYTLVPGLNQDLNIVDGNYTFTVDLAAKTLSVTGEAAAFVAPTLYLRGDINSWGYDDATKFAASEVDEEGNITYTLSIPELAGEFKIANDNWGVNYGYGAMPGAGTYNVVKDAGNMSLPAGLKDITLKLVINKEDIFAGTLTVSGILYGTRKAFAYDVKGTAGENDTYTVTFKSTEAAEEADIVLTDANGQTALTQTVQGIVKGENTVSVDLSELAEGTYAWSVRLISYNENESVAVASAIDLPITGKTQAGVVFMNDANYDTYGYTAIGLGRALGYAFFTPEGTQVGGEGKFYHVGFNTSSNGSSVSRGAALRNYAVFADWSDAKSGYWRVDPLNPEAEPVNMLLSEGATQEGSGLVKLNGEGIGSGSPCVAFRGEGENTEMFAFDEDLCGNNVVKYNIGTADYITAAPVWQSSVAGKFIGLNIDIIPLENGWFVTDTRANINDSNVPAIMWFNNEGEMTWLCANEEAFQDMTGGCNAGMAITADGMMAAVGSYNSGDMKIHLFTLEFNEDNDPVFTYMMSIDQLPMTNNVTGWAQMQFDAANNLIVYDRRNAKLVTYVLPGGSMATTPAKAEYAINKASGIEDITVGNEEAPAQYFNLNGVEVNAENLTPGIYVRRQGNTATKVVVR